MISHFLQNRPDISVDADGAIRNRRICKCFPLVDAGVCSIGILRRHLPERIFDDTGSVGTHAQFQKEDPAVPAAD